MQSPSESESSESAPGSPTTSTPTISNSPGESRSQSAPSRHTSLAVVIDDGEVIDLKTITLPEAMRLYPFVLGMQHTLRRMIEKDMEWTGSVERQVGPIRYEMKPTEVWEVNDAMTLRNKLLLAAAQVDANISVEEVEAAIEVFITAKADNHKLNTLEKRSTSVRESIAAHRKRTTIPARLKYRTMGAKNG